MKLNKISKRLLLLNITVRKKPQKLPDPSHPNITMRKRKRTWSNLVCTSVFRISNKNEIWNLFWVFLQLIPSPISRSIYLIVLNSHRDLKIDFSDRSCTNIALVRAARLCLETQWKVAFLTLITKPYTLERKEAYIHEAEIQSFILVPKSKRYDDLTVTDCRSELELWNCHQ